MPKRDLKRGSAVIWTQRGKNNGSAKMVLGVVQAPVESDTVKIEVVEPDQLETLIVTVPADQVRPI
jgi:hypothetical protein